MNVAAANGPAPADAANGVNELAQPANTNSIDSLSTQVEQAIFSILTSLVFKEIGKH